MSEIDELEARLRQSQKKISDLQYEVNAIHMELMKLKDEGKPVQLKTEVVQKQPVKIILRHLPTGRYYMKVQELLM